MINLQTDWVYLWAAIIGIVGLLLAAWLCARTGRGWRGLLLNVLVISLASVTSLVAVGLVVNRFGTFYMQLSDLWAQGDGAEQNAGDPSDLYTDPPSATPSPGAGAAAGTRQAAALPPLPSPGQRIQWYKVPTSVGHRSWDVAVLLPDGYEQNPTATYPVVMALHGSPGNSYVYIAGGRMNLATLGDPLVKGHKVAPFIAVIPNITPDGKDTECAFGPDGKDQLETWLSKDVPAFVKGHLRVKPDRASWATLGYSFGAWCAPMLTVLHPDVFGASISLSGYFRPQWTVPPPFGRISPEARRLDLIAELKNRPKVSAFVQAARNDPSVFPTSQEFLKQAQKHGLYTTAVIDESGGHSWNLWIPRIPVSLEWLGKTLPGFKP